MKKIGIRSRSHGFTENTWYKHKTIQITSVNMFCGVYCIWWLTVYAISFKWTVVWISVIKTFTIDIVQCFLYNFLRLVKMSTFLWQHFFLRFLKRHIIFDSNFPGVYLEGPIATQLALQDYIWITFWEFIIHISNSFVLNKFLTSYTILHMSRQQICRVLCTIPQRLLKENLVKKKLDFW